MIQVQYFQSLLQAKIYLHFALRNSLFSASQKVDKNAQRLATNRNCSLTISIRKRLPVSEGEREPVLAGHRLIPGVQKEFLCIMGVRCIFIYNNFDRCATGQFQIHPRKS